MIRIIEEETPSQPGGTTPVVTGKGVFMKMKTFAKAMGKGMRATSSPSLNGESLTGAVINLVKSITRAVDMSARVDEARLLQIKAETELTNAQLP